MAPNLKLLNFNAYRSTTLQRFRIINDMINNYDPFIVTIQEIHIGMAIKFFSGKFQIIVNLESNAKDQIGICMLISKDIIIKDKIVGENGRIIGVNLGNLQVWNIYGKSGTQHKITRDQLFKEDLPTLMELWMDICKEILVVGDFNCTNRKCDSLNNPETHFQKALIDFMKGYRLSDDFVYFSGGGKDFSRITKRSSTRIDFSLSNFSSECKRYNYINFPTLDHKIIYAEYSIDFSFKQEKIPRKRICKNWVINKKLENDDIFNGIVNKVFEQVQLELDQDLDSKFKPTFVWFKLKQIIVKVAKSCHKTWKDSQEYEYERICQYYDMAVNDMVNGLDNCQELKMIINELNKHYRGKIEEKILDRKHLEIKNHVFDLNKRQKDIKFSNGKVNKIRINDVTYDSKVGIVDAIEKSMRGELKTFEKLTSDNEENVFLDYLSKVDLDEDEVNSLEENVTEKEVFYILENEVDLDSSPGMDGLTYRFIKHFWRNKTFRTIYMNFINHVKDSGDFGRVQNIGLMVIKNKKGNSIEYSKKRKITKVNKDVNILGKCWSNRLRDKIMPKIIPDSQYNCRQDVNIVDELKEIRDANLYLLGNNGKQNDGSILSLDFVNAFRSVSHRWFDLVLKKIGLPKKFIDWFWNLYRNLGIVINVNGCKSSIISNDRGFLEGSPPSMGAFCISTFPLLIALERNMKGIKIKDGRVFKIKVFADDMKTFIREVREVEIIEKLIFNFEKVSGIYLHRDKTKKKCNILNFGRNRNHENWPNWINVVDQMQVIGGLFTNNGSLEKINSELIKNKCIGTIMSNFNMTGTIDQKVYFLNTYCFSKLTYLSQAFMVDKKVLDEIKKYALRYIYIGKNERPAQSLNFRAKNFGGLNLVYPEIKAKSLLLKSMLKEIKIRELDVGNNTFSKSIYGPIDELLKIWKNGKKDFSAKDIYSDLIVQKVYDDNGILIPSRVERKYHLLDWTIFYKNFKKVKYINAVEKEFMFLFVQDLLPVPARIHRRNNDSSCQRKLEDGRICAKESDRKHFFMSCEVVEYCYIQFRLLVCEFLEMDVGDVDLLHFTFEVKNKHKRNLAIWIVLKYFYMIYKFKIYDFKIFVQRILGEIEFLLMRNKIVKTSEIQFIQTLLVQEL